eukprot:COSAG02_NODE_3155_length_7265_cov_6.553586_2_plen_146_part_00
MPLVVVRPGQRVSVSGDPSLPRPPRWGGGSFTVQQRGSLSLEFVEVSVAISVNGGELSLSRMDVPADVVGKLSAGGAGSAVRLSEVTVTTTDGTQWPQLQPGTLVASTGFDGALTLDPLAVSILGWFFPVRPLRTTSALLRLLTS